MIYLVFMGNGQLVGSYFDKQRAHRVARINDGVVVRLPITNDYRK